MSDEDDLARLATDTLSSLIDEYGSVKTTVGQLLAQFGHNELTSDAIDDVWMALRDAGMRETPILSESKLALDSKVKIRRIETNERSSARPQPGPNTMRAMQGGDEAGMASCAECGAALADGAKFCHACGTPVIETVPTAGAPAVPHQETEPPRPAAPPPPPPATPRTSFVGANADKPPESTARKQKRWPWVVAGIVVLIVIIAAAAGGSKKSPSTTTPAAASTPTAPPEPAVSLHLNAGSYTTTSRSTTLSGNVTPGAQVTVNGHPAQLHGGFWNTTIGLQHGENSVEVHATMAGHTAAEETITVTRETSAAERAAEAEAEEHSYKAQATTIPYPELNKDPEAFDGKTVTYTGQIFQIHEEGTEGGGWMLLSVTEEYEIWSNHIYVSFTGHVKGAEKSMVTIWGKVKGAKSYQTQIGGETTVPEVEAKYVSG